MFRIKSILVYIVAGLLLCPLALDYSLFDTARADFIDTRPTWASPEQNFTGAVAWGDFDNDGDLDFVTGNNGPNFIYYNDNGKIPKQYSWRSTDLRNTVSFAIADYDNDGDIDLAAGNSFGRDALYLNVNGKLLTTPVWNSSISEFTTALKWGDVDNDGDLDLVVGHYDYNVAIYRNTGGSLGQTPWWTTNSKYFTNDIALCDINNDNLVDLYLGNGKLTGVSKDLLFLNKGTGYLQTPDWQPQLPRKTTSVDFGDYDNDGDLDLAVGTLNQGTFVHDNILNNLETKASWTAGDSSTATFDVRWADTSGNGYLDLILAINGKNAIYRNTGGVLESFASWHSDDTVGSSSIAVGDYDIDASLDLAFGNDVPGGEPNKIHHNNGTVISDRTSWSKSISDTPYAVALHDFDGNGYSDLAVATSGRNLIFFNSVTGLSSSAGWTSSDSADTRSLAVGDIDNDGDMDLVAGNYGGSVVTYRNNIGSLMQTPWWTSSTTSNVSSMALADLDTDGDLDLAVANNGQANYIYFNTGSGLLPVPSWYSNTTGLTTDVAWGDIDNDGYLDLAFVGSGEGYEVFRNTGSIIKIDPDWTGSYVNDTRSVGWADINGDGSADLVTGAYNASTYVYLNTIGGLSSTPSWQAGGPSARTCGIELLDMNGDGRTDLFESNNGDSNRIHINIGGTFRAVPSWNSFNSISSVRASAGDTDNDGDFDIAVANTNGLIELYSNSFIMSPSLINNPTYAEITSPQGLISSSKFSSALPYKDDITIKYKLYDPEGAEARIKPEYSTDGGGTWVPAKRSSADTDGTTGLTASAAGNTYTFLWDSKSDNIVSQNVLFGISVYSIHDVPGRIQRPYTSTYTGPLTVESPRFNPPLNLTVTDPTTNSLNLRWTERPLEPVTGYYIYMNASFTGQSGPFVLVKTVGKVSNSVITNLANGVTYYFKIKSYDALGATSMFSNVGIGTTLKINLPPVVSSVIPNIVLDEDTKLLNYINLNNYFNDELINFSDMGNDGLDYTLSSNSNIKVWLTSTESLNIEPAPNYFGTEQFTVTASDSEFQTEQGFKIFVNSINDRPILNLTDGFTLYGVQNEELNFRVHAFDPADPHDILKFYDNATLFDIEENTGIISFVPLPWDLGTYDINITVTDNGVPELRASANIRLVINKTKEPMPSDPPISTLIYPESSSIVTTKRPTFIWDGRDTDSPEIFYDLYISSEETQVYELNFFARMAEGLRSNSYTMPTNLTHGLTYYWTVIPNDGQVKGSCESGIWQFSIDISQPSPTVKLINPANQMIVNSTTIRLTWSLDYEGSERIRYFVYFDTSDIPKNLLSSDSSEQYIDATDLRDGETYYWTVIPRAGNVIGTCVSGIWTFKVNFAFVQIFGVSLYTAPFITISINENKLHDATIVNDGNNVDTFLVTLTAGTLQGFVSLQSEWLTLTSLASGFLELEPFQAITISLVFKVHDPELIGLHFVELSVISLGARYTDVYIEETADISVSIGEGDWTNPDKNKPPDDSNINLDINDTGTPKKRVQKNPTLDWTYILLAVLIAVIIIISYTAVLLRQTRKKFDEYQTAREILESKSLDGTHPLVAKFLAKTGVRRKGKPSKLGGVHLTPMEVETLKEALVVGSGRYMEAEDEHSLVDKPYKSAAVDMLESKIAEHDAHLSGAAFESYQPEHYPIPMAKPYSAAARSIPIASRAPEDNDSIPIAAPMASAVDLDSVKTTRTLKKRAYQPGHLTLSSARPYSRAGKLYVLEQRLRDGKISKRLYEELKQKYIEETPVRAKEARPISYQPDLMPVPFAKPYDKAAKEQKLKQKYKDGKINKRLYDELKKEYTE
jgi:hypothetical protein